MAISNFSFQPATLTVPVGTTVTWTNNDQAPHTVTGNTANGPNSSVLLHGQSYARTFTQPGTYTYFCAIHPEMHGTVVVQ